jgi:hypothetical protein
MTPCGLQRETTPARARITISDLPTHILVSTLITNIQLPYTTRLVKKFAAEEVQSRGHRVTLRNLYFVTYFQSSYIDLMMTQ